MIGLDMIGLDMIVIRFDRVGWDTVSAVEGANFDTPTVRKVVNCPCRSKETSVILAIVL